MRSRIDCLDSYEAAMSNPAKSGSRATMSPERSSSVVIVLKGEGCLNVQ